MRRVRVRVVVGRVGFLGGRGGVGIVVVVIEEGFVGVEGLDIVSG